MLFWFDRRRNRKFSTTSLVHRAVRYIKIDTDASLVELLYCYTMRPRDVIPLVSVRGITVNSRMDHRCMNFCKPKAKESLSDLQRFSLCQFKHTSSIQWATNKLKNKDPAMTASLRTARSEARMELHYVWLVIFLEQGATKAKAFTKLKSQKTR
jgi:hypothetical protein